MKSIRRNELNEAILVKYFKVNIFLKVYAYALSGLMKTVNILNTLNITTKKQQQHTKKLG